jgi:hypothetical protein
LLLFSPCAGPTFDQTGNSANAGTFLHRCTITYNGADGASDHSTAHSSLACPGFDLLGVFPTFEKILLILLPVDTLHIHNYPLSMTATSQSNDDNSPHKQWFHPFPPQKMNL